MSRSNSHRLSDFEVHEDLNCISVMAEDKDVKEFGGVEVTPNEKEDIGEALSQSNDPQGNAEDNSDMEDSEDGGDSMLDPELPELQEDDSILQSTQERHNEHDDCEDCKHAREEKRKRARAKELQMQEIEAEVKAAALKVMESIEKEDPERIAAANGHNDKSYEPEDHDDSLLSANTDESHDASLYNEENGTELTYDATKTTMENGGQSEDQNSVLHLETSSTDTENEHGDTGGEDIGGGDSTSHYGNVEDDVSNSGSGKSARFSVGSADETHNRVSMSNRSSWQSNRQLDLSKEAQQLVELNSPVVGEEASTESVISGIPSGSNASAPRARDSLYSPRKISRHPFHTPSDIRAMQMYSPAPSLFSTPLSSKRQHPTVSRLGTPTGSQYSKSRTPIRFKKNREESPLVLLHVTVLPLRWQYSKAIVAPELPANLYNIREAYYLLQEKLSETILTRGILLPHPQDSYECLEERFLDALELPFRPRAKILKCGHYIGPDTTSSDDDSMDERDSGFGSTGRFKAKFDKIWCDICRRDVRYEDDYQDEDDKRFKIKIFASNGLMRAGAWAAAWREMERVDVEIEPFVQPWMVEDMEELIERLKEAEEEGREDNFGDYSDDSGRESLGSEAQRLHEQQMSKVTLRQKTADIGSRNTRAEWLASASKAAKEEAENIARNAEILRPREEEARRYEEAEEMQAEPETLRISKIMAERLRLEAEIEAIGSAEGREGIQKHAGIKSNSSQSNEGTNQLEKELETEAQRLHEEEMAADQALDEEAQRIHAAEVAEQRALEEEAQKIYEVELAEREAHEEALRTMGEERSSQKSQEEEDFKKKLEGDEAKLAEEARLKNVYNQASTRTKRSSSSPRPRNTPGGESFTQLLIKATGVAMRDRKNILIAILSVIVLFLSLKPNKELPVAQYTPEIIIQNHRYEVGNSGLDQRGYDTLWQAVTDGNAPMRDIEGSMSRKSHDVIVVGSSKGMEHALSVAQSEVAVETQQKREFIEIEAPKTIPVIEGDVGKVPHAKRPEANEDFHLGEEMNPASIAKHEAKIEATGTDDLPGQIMDVTSKLDTQHLSAGSEAGNLDIEV